MANRKRLDQDLLRDLDIHLRELAPYLRHDLITEDEAPRLSNSLRLLTCKTSGKEGLLWRLAMRPDFSVSTRIEIGFFPVSRSMALLNKEATLQYRPPLTHEMDPSAPTYLCDFKTFMRTERVITVLSKSYTFDDIIRIVADKLGGAHSDDELDETDAELVYGVKIGERPLAYQVIGDILPFVLQVGERVRVQAIRLGIASRGRGR